MTQLFRYTPTEQGETVPGVPADALTEEWLTQAAAARGVSVDALSAELAAYQRADGKPLYAATPKAKEELGPAALPPEPPADKPKVPLGTKPRG